MTQYSRPFSDILVSSWTASVGSDLYPVLDEETPSDADYVSQTLGADEADTFTVGLSEVTNPVTSSAHTMRARTRIVGPGDSAGWQFSLQDGATVVHSHNWNQSAGGWATVEYTLSGSEVGDISDYGNLTASISITTDAGNPIPAECQCSWVEFEVPDVSAGRQVYVYDGTQWVQATDVYVYDGTQWIQSTSLSIYDGTDWESEA